MGKIWHQVFESTLISIHLCTVLPPGNNNTLLTTTLASPTTTPPYPVTGPTKPLVSTSPTPYLQISVMPSTLPIPSSSWPLPLLPPTAFSAPPFMNSCCHLSTTFYICMLPMHRQLHLPTAHNLLIATPLWALRLSNDGLHVNRGTNQRKHFMISQLW